MPKFSILMSVFDCENTIRSALQSLVNQSFSSFEVVIVCDGCRDATAEIVRSYSDKLKLVVIERAVNSGLTRSLNIGLDHCSGEYILRLDSDDFYLPDYIEAVNREVIEARELDLVCFGAVKVSDDTIVGIPSLRAVKFAVENRAYKDYILTTNINIHGGFCFRATSLKKMKYNENYVYAQDYECFLRFRRLGQKVEHRFDIKKYVLTSSKQSISSRKFLEQSYFALSASLVNCALDRSIRLPRKLVLMLIASLIFSRKILFNYAF